MARGVVIEVNNGLQPDLAAASTVEVLERMGASTRFSLSLPVDIAGGDIPGLADARLDPGARVGIFADNGAGGVDCLVVGEVEGQSIALVHGGEGSALSVTGGDACLAMDRETRTTVWEGPTMTDAMVVTSIVANYGLVPQVESTVASHPSQRHALVQRRSDLGFVRQLARRNGFLFYIRPQAAAIGPVVETAHFGPPRFQDGGLAELRINSDDRTIDRLDIGFDLAGPTSVLAEQVDLSTAQSFNADTDMTFVEPLGSTPVDRIGPSPRSLRLTAATDTAGELGPRGDGVLAEAQFFLRAQTMSTVQRLGRIVRAHDTVRVIGAGARHSGRYYVAAVRHRIDALAHVMGLELVRNAWGEEAGLPGLPGIGGLP